MARYYEAGKVLASLIQDKNRLKAQIISPTDTLQIGKKLSSNIGLETFNLIATTRNTDPDTIWDRAGTNWDEVNWDNGYDNPKVVVSRLKQTWTTQSELSAGASHLVDISQGDIRLNL